MECLGDTLAAVVDVPTDREWACAVVGGQGFAYFGAALGPPAMSAGQSAAPGVESVFAFVAAHDRELDAIYGQKIVEGQAQVLGDQDIDFQQGLATGEVGAQGATALPKPPLNQGSDSTEAKRR